MVKVTYYREDWFWYYIFGIILLILNLYKQYVSITVIAWSLFLTVIIFNYSRPKKPNKKRKKK